MAVFTCIFISLTADLHGAADVKTLGRALLARGQSSRIVHSLVCFLWRCQMSDCFVEAVSEVKKGGGGGLLPLPAVACLLSFDLLPRMSWRLDEQKGQSEGNLQSFFPAACFLSFPYGFDIKQTMGDIVYYKRSILLCP